MTKNGVAYNPATDTSTYYGSMTSACIQCTIPGYQGGSAIADNTSVTLYSVSSIGCGQTASTYASTFSCPNGVLQKNGAAYNPATDTNHYYSSVNNTCVQCVIPGYEGGAAIAANSSVTLYSAHSLACGQTASQFASQFSCGSTDVLLKNGAAYNPSTDTNTYYASMTNTCVGCPTPWGATIPIGTVINAYKASGSSSNTCGGGCKSQQQTCQATGTMSGDNSYNLQACTNTCSQEGGGAPPRMCLLPWQNSYVTPDSKIPMWSRKTVACGDSCQNYFRVGRCLLSSGIFDAGLQYIYQSCTELPCGSLSVTAISPTWIAPSGGPITITGSGFSSSNPPKVTIGGNSCTGVNVVGATTLTCNAPANSGAQTVVVTSSTGSQASPATPLTYYSGTCTGGPGTKIYSVGTSSFTLPAGCTSFAVKAWGAGGAGQQSGNISVIPAGQSLPITTAGRQLGGAGGFASGIVPAVAGQTFTIAVGSGGGDWANGIFYGAGGGGYSGVFTASPSQATALIMAGGGGGAGRPGGCNTGTGGEGGGLSGGSYGTCSGQGGSQLTGGAAGGANATAGTAMQGGNNGSTSALAPGGSPGGGQGGTANPSWSGGGGGGGYFGGGAGTDGIANMAGAGGGGSGYLAPTVTSGVLQSGQGFNAPMATDPSYQSGIAAGGNNGAGGNGLIVISY